MKTNLNRQLLVLFSIVATELIGFGIIIPVLPVISNQYDVSHYMMGILMSSFSLAQLFFAPILGHLSDKYGRKNILIVSKIGTIIAYIIFAFSKNYWLFLLSRLLDGVTGGNIAVARAYIADITTPKTRPRGMAVIGMSFGLGFILGPIIGGFSYQHDQGQLICGIIAASLSLTALFLTIWLLKEPIKHKAEPSFSLYTSMKLVKKPIVLLLFFVYLIYMIIFSGFEVTFSIFMNHDFYLKVHQISWIFVYVGVLGFLTQGYISSKKSQQYFKFICIGFSFMAIGFLGLSFSTVLLMVLSSLTFLAVGGAFVMVYMPSLVLNFSNQKNRGVYMGIYESIGSLGRVFGPFLIYLLPYRYISLEYRIFSIILISLIVTLCFQMLSYKLKYQSS